MKVKYGSLKELADAFISGELEGWVLMLDNDSTYLRWQGGLPDGMELNSDDLEEFHEKKDEEGETLYDGSDDVYILDQALDIIGIPNMGV